MNRGMRGIAALFAACAAFSVALSQNNSTFDPINVNLSAFKPLDNANDIFVTDLGGHKFRLTLGLSPTITLNSQLLHVTFIFGFWALSDFGGNLAASGVPQNGWGWDPQGTEVAGWHNPNKSFKLMPGNSLDFQYAALDESQLDTFGYHVSLVENFPGTGGNTGFVKGVFVPEPSSAAALLTGAFAVLGLARRRLR